MSKFPSPIVQLYIGDKCLSTQGKSPCLCKGAIPVLKNGLESPPVLEWYDIKSLDSEEPAQLLAAFELYTVLESDENMAQNTFLNEAGGIPIPPAIRPHFSIHRIEVLFWGLRELKRVKLTQIEAPILEVECGENIIQSSIISSYKKHSNFLNMVEIIDMELPEKESYFPALTIRLLDCKSFGRRTVIASHIIHRLQKYVVRPNGQLLQSKYDEPSKLVKSDDKTDAVIDVEYSEEDEDSEIIQNVRLPWAYSTSLAEENGDEVEQDWWSRYYISRKEMPQNRKFSTLSSRLSMTGRKSSFAYNFDFSQNNNFKMQNLQKTVRDVANDASGVSENYFQDDKSFLNRKFSTLSPRVSMAGRRSTFGCPIQTTFYTPQNGRDTMSEYQKNICNGVSENHKFDARGFIVFSCELENVPEFGGFKEWLHSFELTRGRTFARFRKSEKTVAVFKGCFRIYKLPLPQYIIDPFLPFKPNREVLFDGLPENKATSVLVRVYIVEMTEQVSRTWLSIFCIAGVTYRLENTLWSQNILKRERCTTPRSSGNLRYELRVIIWNTDEVVLSDDAFFTGEKMSDIYVKGSLTGEGNFNWRFVFPFDYLPIEKKMVVMKKVTMFSWDETEFKKPPELTLQVFDADNFKSDDFLGEITLNLHHFPRGAKSAALCNLEMLKEDGTVPQISLFRQQRVRGWWPVSAENQDGDRELTGKVEAELHLLKKEEAERSPVGLGRKEPDPLPEPKRPETSFANFLDPLKTFRYAFWKRYKKKIIQILIIAAMALILLLFVYSAPGYIVKKLLGA